MTWEISEMEIEHDKISKKAMLEGPEMKCYGGLNV